MRTDIIRGSAFGGHVTLSDAAAAALAQFKGDLSLDGLTTLSDAAAAALAKHKGELSLDGLTTLSDAAAAALAKHKGDLSLDALTTLSVTAAIALTKMKVSRPGYFDESQARRYVMEKSGPPHQLRHMSKLSDEAAAILGAGSMARSPKILESPAQKRGITYKDGRHITPGSLFFYDSRKTTMIYRRLNLDLSALSELSDAAATALVRDREVNLNLSGLTALSDAAASVFASHRGWLVLVGLQELSATARVALLDREKCILPAHLAE